jgi:hypothetical protein
MLLAVLLVWFLLAPVLGLIVGASIRGAEKWHDDATREAPCQQFHEHVEELAAAG